LWHNIVAFRNTSELRPGLAPGSFAFGDSIPLYPGWLKGKRGWQYPYIKPAISARGNNLWLTCSKNTKTSGFNTLKKRNLSTDSYQGNLMRDKEKG